MAKRRIFISLLLLFAFLTIPVLSQRKITSPKEQFGFNLGDDYQLANYTQLETYWKKLALESRRISLAGMGITAEGRPMYMAIVTSPENQQRLNRYKEIARRLALAEGLTDEEARALAAEGKAVVWIDGGLHASEILGSQQLMELVYQMVSRNDPETQRILNDVILLAVCPNPDGMELVANWYMREKDPTKRSMSGLPRLYQKYIGHDNNRDFYMVTQPETEGVCRVLYNEWFPQIVYNHHQTGPAGNVLFAPPFRDPFNYCFDPLVPTGIELVGAAMHNRFVAEGKPGATMRSGAGYSTWWNGGLRTTTYFHNMIGILTETIGNPTPIEIPFIPQKQLPKFDQPYPIEPQKWQFRQSIDYMITADRAILDLASRYREEFLFNIYRMGKNSIKKGSQDTWTIHPKRIAAVEETIANDKVQPTFGRGYPLKYYEILRDPAERDPRGYIIPSNQPDFLTATKFVNALIKNGVAVQRATSSFQVGGKSYAEGSYVIICAQAFRPHLLSMFEPQDHPDDIPYPGAAPVAPYDITGWTLAYQMGVEFDRILDGFEGPFEKIQGLIKPAEGKISQSNDASGFLLSHQVNDAFIATNRLLRSKEEVYWLKEAFQANDKTYPAGTIYIKASQNLKSRLEKLAKDLGLNFESINQSPNVEAFRLQAPRIGLWDRYSGSIPSGWTRWLLEQFDFRFEVIYAPSLDEGNLSSRYDVLIFPSGAIPSLRAEGEGRFRAFFESQPDPKDVPAEYRRQVGTITTEKTIPQLLKFLDDGGTILVVGSSAGLAEHAGLPLANHLVEQLQDGTEKPLSREKFFVPGSVLQVRVDSANPLAYGMPDKVDVLFNNNPVFRLKPESALNAIHPVAWFESKKPLRSGWAWGQHYLEGGMAVLEAKIGKGKLFLYGPEVTFRGQPHGTLKFLFNGIYYGSAASVKLE